jgi:hypothetical protein
MTGLAEATGDNFGNRAEMGRSHAAPHVTVASIGVVEESMSVRAV